jgi:hypothetical protein
VLQGGQAISVHAVLGVVLLSELDLPLHMLARCVGMTSPPVK